MPKKPWCLLWKLYKHLINILGFLPDFEINSCLGATQLWLFKEVYTKPVVNCTTRWYLGRIRMMMSMERWNSICYIIPCQFSIGNLTGARGRMRGGHGWDCEIPVCWHQIFQFQYCCVYCGRMILLKHGSASGVELFELDWQVVKIDKNWTSESGKCCFLLFLMAGLVV